MGSFDTVAFVHILIRTIPKATNLLVAVWPSRRELFLRPLIA
jgi:hypothetical protein